MNSVVTHPHQTESIDVFVSIRLRFLCYHVTKTLTALHTARFARCTNFYKLNQTRSYRYQVSLHSLVVPWTHKSPPFACPFFSLHIFKHTVDRQKHSRLSKTSCVKIGSTIIPTDPSKATPQNVIFVFCGDARQLKAHSQATASATADAMCTLHCDRSRLPPSRHRHASAVAANATPPRSLTRAIASSLSAAPRVGGLVPASSTLGRTHYTTVAVANCIAIVASVP